MHGREAARTEKRTDERRGIDFAERFQMQHRVARALRLHFGAGQKLGPRRANEHHRAAQVFDQEMQHVDGLLVREVQIVEYETERPLAASISSKTLQDGAFRHRRVERGCPREPWSSGCPETRAPSRPPSTCSTSPTLRSSSKRGHLRAYAELRLFGT